MDQLSNPNQPRPSSTTTTAERYRYMWQQGPQQNHHGNRIDIDREMMKMKQEEHKRRMEVLEEQHAAKMSVLEMEKDLVKMKIEAFLKEMRKDVDVDTKDNEEVLEDVNSNHSNQRDNDNGSNHANTDTNSIDETS